MFKEIPSTEHSIKCRRPCLGGALNDANYLVYYVGSDGSRYTCPIYAHWHNMLIRVHNERYREKLTCYDNVIICDEWYLYSNFYKWAKNKHYLERGLDKDLKNNGNKIYSPENCIFVPPRINKIIQNKKRTKHDLPTGVTVKSDGKFISRCNDGNKRVYLGVYSCKHEAGRAYRKYKKGLIIREAQNYKNEPDLYSALISSADRY